MGGITEIGVISDTHGLLRPEALEALEGSHLILHAGDVGDDEILDRLREIAPVHAVRGNCDYGGWAEALPITEVVEARDVSFYMIHDVDQLDLDPAAAGFDAVVFGHSHRPEIVQRNGVTFLNPGSAGPRRFTLPVTVARVRVTDGSLDVRLVDLQVAAR